MENHEVAIIGMSGIYPLAENLRDFYAVLSQGVDCVREVSSQRRALLGIPESEPLGELATLERVDEFDHKFFNISLKESEYMDPQQRLLLQLACAAIENAGYSLRHLRGSKTAVILSASNSDYQKLFDQLDPTVSTGILPAALAGRIAYILDLHGPAFVVDTACSSSLVAIYEASRKVASGEVDFALAGGINIFFTSRPVNAAAAQPGSNSDSYGESADIGIMAPDGRSKTFDAAANGTGWGEGGGIVFLKSLARAVEDRDVIQAVIKGGAINQDGGRSSGLTAPSPVAQTEVMLAAWQAAAVDPDTISYIEAHGTGTKLGDPIEIQGINDAFTRGTNKTERGNAGSIGIGSVKTNIGHLVGAAGIAGLTKTVLSLKHKKVFPSLHFNEANPLIDFANSPVSVESRLRDWNLPFGTSVRRAGISSFGLSGTNAHLILEEAPPARKSVDDSSSVLFTLSAKQPQALNRHVSGFISWLKESECSLADIAYTANTGRDAYPYRFACVARNKEGLVTALERFLLETSQPNEAARSDRPVIFLLSGREELNAGLIDRLNSDYREFSQAVTACRQVLEHDDAAPELQSFLFQYGLFKTWSALGINSSKLIGAGPGNGIVANATGRMTLEETLQKVSLNHWPSTLDPQKLKTVLAEVTRSENPLFLEIGGRGVLGNAISNFNGDSHKFEVVTAFNEAPSGCLLEAMARLYVVGARIDWEKFYDGQTHYRVELPTYPFEKTSCWIRTTGLRQAEQPARTSKTPDLETRSFGVLADPQPTETQRKVAAIWGEVLKVEQLGLEDDYFDLGGNSLNGTQLITRLEKEFGAKLEFEDLYDYCTVAGIAAHLDSMNHALDSSEPSVAKPATLSRVDRDGLLPLSFAQQRLWFLDELEPGSAFYNMTFAASLSGSLLVEVLESALREVVARHDILRTSFHTVEGTPRQTIAPDLMVSLTIEDLTVLPELERAAAANRLATEEAQRPFDLSRPPLMRASLLRLDEHEHILLLTMHHIVSDYWSVGLLIQEMATLYGAFAAGLASPLPELPIQYADFAHWQQSSFKGEVLDKQLAYWKTMLKGSSGVLELTPDKPRPAIQTFRGAREYAILPRQLTESLKLFSRQEEVTLFMTLFAAFQVLLYRYTGQEDISVGTPIANRNRPEIEKLIGFFANTLVLRSDLSGGPSFRELVQRVREVALGAYAHQDLPFERLVEELQPRRDLSRTPLFQVLFVFQNIALEVYRLPELNISFVEPDTGTSKFDLTLSMMERGGSLAMRLEYNTDIFEAATIKRMLRHMENLLQSIVTDPNQKLYELELMTIDERERIVKNWNDTRGTRAPARCVHHLFEQQAARTPDEVAAVFEDQSVSYRELDQRANRLANHLRKLGVGPDITAGILCERSLDLLVAVLGVLKSGGAYLPLDPRYPQQRLAYMLEDSGAHVLLTHRGLHSVLGGCRLPVVDLDVAWPAITNESEAISHADMTGEELAYVIYTSGSTGNPKGVAMPHRALTNLIEWQVSALKLVPKARTLGFSSISFDASFNEMFTCWYTGGMLLLPSDELRQDTSRLIDFLNEHRVGRLFLPFVALSQLANVFSETGRFPEHVREILCTAEQLQVSDSVRQLFSRSRACRLLNEYGPSESHVVTVHELHGPATYWPKLPPIGRPIANTEIYLLEDNLEVCPIGVPGELYIGGDSLARGYVGRPAMTAGRFIPDPFSTAAGSRLYRTGDIGRYSENGEIEFLGRKDNQVKIRGFRIEPGEIETLLRKNLNIKEAVITVAEDDTGDKRLIAHLVAQGKTRLSPDDLRGELKQHLPDYMVPSAFNYVADLPLTPSGKIDRLTLARNLDWKQTLKRAYVAPRTEVEESLARMWAEVLKLERVGIHDNFFEIGGHSLLAAQLISRVRTVQGLELPLRTLFEDPTVAGLAKAIELLKQQHAVKAPSPIPRRSRTIDRQLSELEFTEEPVHV
jgi:amino acid adenylation domain-containing protein